MNPTRSGQDGDSGERTAATGVAVVEQQSNRGRNEQHREGDRQHVVRQAVQDVGADHRSHHRADGQERADLPVDLVFERIARETGDRDRQHGGQRRTVGETLGESEHEHECGHDQDPATDAEQSGQEPGEQADEHDPQARVDAAVAGAGECHRGRRPCPESVVHIVSGLRGIAGSACEAGDEMARRLLLQRRRCAAASVMHQRAARLETCNPAAGRPD